MTEPRETSDPSAWRPLLTGEAAQRAEAAVLEIASALAARPQTETAGEEVPGSPRDLSLAGGEAGIALFFSYLDAARPGEGHDETAMAHLERAIAGTAELPAAAGLYSGFAGVAWVLEHLTGRLFDPEGEDPGEEIATILAEHLARSPWLGDYDLISGLVGFGVYALERLPRPGGRECLARVLERLAEIAEAQAPGVTWHTRVELVGPYQRESFPEGYYNLGVAHGVPGVIGLLGDALGAAPAGSPSAASLPEESAALARRLLTGAVDWLSAQHLPPDSVSRFPYNRAPGMTATSSRLAWCYGDLGIAAALLSAVRAAGTAAPPAWEAEAVALARQAAARPAEGAGVIDSGLCHGAAGVAHLFNRLYQATGEETLAAAAGAWFDRALAQYRPGEGVGGFRAWLPTGADRMGNLDWGDDPGFLTGSAGIGLALLAAISPVTPDWDRVLLTDIRGARQEGR